MTQKPLTTFDDLTKRIVRVVAYGLSLGTDMVITVDADFKWKVWWN